MSGAAIILIGCALISYFTYRRIKRMPIHSIEGALKQYNYDHVLEVLDSITASRFMSEFERDYMRLKVMFLGKSKEEFLNQADIIFAKSYKGNEKELFLLNWYLRFLLYRSREFADIFLKAVQQNCSDEQNAYCDLAYKVFLDKDNALLDELYQRLTACRNGGFPMGIYHFLIATVYEQQHEIQKAVQSYDNSLFCFEMSEIHPFDQYAYRFIRIHGDTSNLHYPQEKVEKEINYQDMYVIPNVKKRKDKKGIKK